MPLYFRESLNLWNHGRSYANGPLSPGRVAASAGAADFGPAEVCLGRVDLLERANAPILCGAGNACHADAKEAPSGDCDPETAGSDRNPDDGAVCYPAQRGR